MFKVSFFVKKKDSVDAKAFRDYWLGRHAEQQQRYLEQLGVRQYLKCEVLADHALTIEGRKNFGTGPLRYDFVDHWVFNDIGELRRGSMDPALQALMAQAQADEDAMLDIGASNVQMSVDLAQFFPPDANDVRATEDSPYYKIYYVVRVLPHISCAQAQLHWNACHGGESRQHIRYSAQKKYIQAHAIESTFVNDLIARRGYEFDPTLVGHAEGWINPDQPPHNLPAKDAARIHRMTMDDIDLFSDKERGCVFFTKEHFIMDEPVVQRTNGGGEDQPMPTLFSAVY